MPSNLASLKRMTGWPPWHEVLLALGLGTLGDYLAGISDVPGSALEIKVANAHGLAIEWRESSVYSP